MSAVDCWNYGSPLYLSKRTKLGIKAEKHPRAARVVGFGPRRLKLVREPEFRFKTRGANPMDFARGIAEVASSIAERRACRMSARFALHVNEIVLAIQSPGEFGSPRVLETTCDAVAPMPWAT